MYKSVCFLLILCIVAESCDDMYYEKDGQCCKMCGPGTRMKLNTDCVDPSCEECEDSEYQDTYTMENKCKPQPSCDPNANFQVQNKPSKTSMSPCKCLPGHHCSSKDCDTCVKNKVCQAGEKVKQNSTQMSDTECEPCSDGTFSSHESASVCQPWTECTPLFIPVHLGSATSDRICEFQKTPVVVAVSVSLFILALALLGFFIYRNRKTGSATFIQTVHKCCRVVGASDHQQNVQDQVCTYNEVEQQEEEITNQPEEDQEEELLKLDMSLKPGISENGQVVVQDHSKSLLISQPETEISENFSVTSNTQNV